MASKLVYGDQLQIRLDPRELDAKNRGQWGRLYLSKQAEKAKLFFSAAAISVASLLSFIVAIKFLTIFFLAGIVFGFFAIKEFFDFGYKKGIIDDWESKIMIRIDK